jgi:hypothetical protein
MVRDVQLGRATRASMSEIAYGIDREDMRRG